VDLGGGAVNSTDRKVRAALRHNNTLFASLTNAVSGLGKKTLAAASAAALSGAMTNRNTKHDSSRAAANWDLEVGHSNPYGKSVSGGLNPSQYHDQEFGVGGRGDQGSNQGQVAEIKAQRYGYSGYGANTTVSENSWLYNALGVGQKGRPAVYLFNPVSTVKGYAENALTGAAQVASTLAPGAKAAGKIAAFEEARRISGLIRLKRGRL
jgi:hypothetical protein